MGHSRLGTLPASQTWDGVVTPLANGADVKQVADQTLVAAHKALLTTKGDPGFREAVYVMAQLGLAGNADDPVAALSAAGIELNDGYSTADLAIAVSAAVDRRMEGKGQRNDWGEMAKGALVSAVTQCLTAKGPTMFEATREELSASLRPLRREKGFGELGRAFFGTMAVKVLNYFLSKTLGTHVGQGRRFATMKEYSEYKRGIATHCKETALIAEKFSGQWLQKQIRDNGGVTTREAAEGFGAHAIHKMQMELAIRAGRKKNED